MSLEIFLLLLLIVSIFTGLFTEGIKKLMDEVNKKYLSNFLAGFVAVVLSVLVDAGYIILTEAQINAKMAVYLIALVLLSWLASMVGYDKVIQAITQCKGDTGSEVTAMQKMLIKVGYSCGAAGADGDFGSDTDSALRKFQKDNGLTVDGQYGTNSKAKLTALYNKKVGTTTSNKKDVTTVAKEVIAGKWGSGDERKKKLTAAGYNYDTVQKKVNELLKTRTKKSVAEVAKEVVSGKWGNGADRKKKLEAAGYNYAEVQKEVNKLLK